MHHYLTYFLAGGISINKKDKNLLLIFVLIKILFKHALKKLQYL